MTTLKTLLLGALLLLSGMVLAQVPQIEQLRQELEQQTGVTYAKAAITLSELEFAAGNAEAALQYARQAYDAARRERHDFYTTMAAYQEAQALLNLPEVDDKDLRKATRHMKRANRFLEDYPDPELRIAALRLTQQLAIALDRGSLANRTGTAIVENEALAEEQKNIPEVAAAPSRHSGGAALAYAVQPDRQRRDTTLYDVIRANKAMQGQLQRYEEQLNLLSADSLKSELLRARLHSMNDSLVLVTQTDSLRLAQQELAISKQRAQKNVYLGIGALILMIAIGLLVRYLESRTYNKVLEAKNAIIEQEKKRSEELLLNILPAAIAEELRQRGAAKARQYKNVTVLFTDFKDFTRISQEFRPEELVQELDYLFSAFDRIIGEHQLEKIKTIGDAYMCAGGLPEEDRDHPQRVIAAALDIQRFLQEYRAMRIQQGRPYFEARIGVHTGPVIAGIVGLKKFAYDIWGTTVNVASRLESKGTVGKVNVSGATYEHLKGQYHFDYRGKVAAKNVGEIEMYFLEEEASTRTLSEAETTGSQKEGPPEC